MGWKKEENERLIVRFFRTKVFLGYFLLSNNAVRQFRIIYNKIIRTEEIVWKEGITYSDWLKIDGDHEMRYLFLKSHLHQRNDTQITTL